MSMLTNLLGKFSSAVSIHRLANSFYTSLLKFYSMRPTPRSLRVKEWASLREKNDYDRVMLVTRSRDESFTLRLTPK